MRIGTTRGGSGRCLTPGSFVPAGCAATLTDISTSPHFGSAGYTKKSNARHHPPGHNFGTPQANDERLADSGRVHAHVRWRRSLAQRPPLPTAHTITQAPARRMAMGLARQTVPRSRAGSHHARRDSDNWRRFSENRAKSSNQQSNAWHQRRARAIEFNSQADLRVRCMPLLCRPRFVPFNPHSVFTASSPFFLATPASHK